MTTLMTVDMMDDSDGNCGCRKLKMFVKLCEKERIRLKSPLFSSASKLPISINEHHTSHNNNSIPHSTQQQQESYNLRRTLESRLTPPNDDRPTTPDRVISTHHHRHGSRFHPLYLLILVCSLLWLCAATTGASETLLKDLQDDQTAATVADAAVDAAVDAAAEVPSVTVTGVDTTHEDHATVTADASTTQGSHATAGDRAVTRENQASSAITQRNHAPATAEATAKAVAVEPASSANRKSELLTTPLLHRLSRHDRHLLNSRSLLLDDPIKALFAQLSKSLLEGPLAHQRTPLPQPLKSQELQKQPQFQQQQQEQTSAQQQPQLQQQPPNTQQPIQPQQTSAQQSPHSPKRPVAQTNQLKQSLLQSVVVSPEPSVKLQHDESSSISFTIVSSTASAIASSEKSAEGAVPKPQSPTNNKDKSKIITKDNFPWRPNPVVIDSGQGAASIKKSEKFTPSTTYRPTTRGVKPTRNSTFEGSATTQPTIPNANGQYSRKPAFSTTKSTPPPRTPASTSPPAPSTTTSTTSKYHSKPLSSDNNYSHSSYEKFPQHVPLQGSNKYTSQMASSIENDKGGTTQENKNNKNANSGSNSSNTKRPQSVTYYANPFHAYETLLQSFAMMAHGVSHTNNDNSNKNKTNLVVIPLPASPYVDANTFENLKENVFLQSQGFLQTPAADEDLLFSDGTNANQRIAPAASATASSHVTVKKPNRFHHMSFPKIRDKNDAEHKLKLAANAEKPNTKILNRKGTPNLDADPVRGPEGATLSQPLYYSDIRPTWSASKNNVSLQNGINNENAPNRKVNVSQPSSHSEPFIPSEPDPNNEFVSSIATMQSSSSNIISSNSKPPKVSSDLPVIGVPVAASMPPPMQPQQIVAAGATIESDTDMKYQPYWYDEQPQKNLTSSFLSMVPGDELSTLLSGLHHEDLGPIVDHKGSLTIEEQAEITSHGRPQQEYLLQGPKPVKPQQQQQQEFLLQGPTGPKPVLNQQQPEYLLQGPTPVQAAQQQNDFQPSLPDPGGSKPSSEHKQLFSVQPQKPQQQYHQMTMYSKLDDDMTTAESMHSLQVGETVAQQQRQKQEQLQLQQLKYKQQQQQQQQQQKQQKPQEQPQQYHHHHQQQHEHHQQQVHDHHDHPTDPFASTTDPSDEQSFIELIDRDASLFANVSREQYVNLLKALAVDPGTEDRQRTYLRALMNDPVATMKRYFSFKNGTSPVSRLLLYHSPTETYTERKIQILRGIVEYALNQTDYLFEVKEPLLYHHDIQIRGRDPAAFLAGFNRQTTQAKDLARFAYASLKASSLIAKQFMLTRQQTVFGLERIPLRNTRLAELCPIRQRSKRIGPSSVNYNNNRRRQHQAVAECYPLSLRFRTSDGSCNNLRHPEWGSALRPFLRFIPPDYNDGIDEMRRSVTGLPLPSAREVSSTIHRDISMPNAHLTLMLMQWGQFTDHDLTSTAVTRGFNFSIPKCCSNDGGRLPPELSHPDCVPIPISPDDRFYSMFGRRCMEFVRSSPAPRPGCRLGPRDQLNQVTSFLDSSVVYGSSQAHSDQLRAFRFGRLDCIDLPLRKPLLPAQFAVKENECAPTTPNLHCFDAGDHRVNEQPGLGSMHTLWMREHNRVALELRRLNNQWGDERLYQEARRIINAQMQHITYNEWLPVVLGDKVIDTFGLRLKKHGFYRDYNESLNPTIANAFAAAALRFGHSLVQHRLQRCDRFHNMVPIHIDFHREIINPSNLHNFGAVDRLMLGLSSQPAQRRDEYIVSELTNHLFQMPERQWGMDLAAINIQRGRDHGLPPYNEWREQCGLKRITHWGELLRLMEDDTVGRLRIVYRHVDDIDLFAGGMAERPVVGGQVGPTFACIIGQQFLNLRQGDRFWYENGNQPSSFTPSQLKELRKATLARVLCNNLDDIDTLQPFLFFQADNTTNKRVRCKQLKGVGIISRVDLSPWKEASSMLQPPPSSFVYQHAHMPHFNGSSGGSSAGLLNEELTSGTWVDQTVPDPSERPAVIVPRPPIDTTTKYLNEMPRPLSATRSWDAELDGGSYGSKVDEKAKITYFSGESFVNAVNEFPAYDDHEQGFIDNEAVEDNYLAEMKTVANANSNNNNLINYSTDQYQTYGGGSGASGGSGGGGSGAGSFYGGTGYYSSGGAAGNKMSQNRDKIDAFNRVYSMAYSNKLYYRRRRNVAL